MKCCEFDVKVCKNCEQKYCKHYKSTYSWKMCTNCVSSVIEKFEAEQ